MNVLHVAQSFDLCGRSRMIHELCAGLAPHGIHGQVAVLGGSVGYRPPDLECVARGRGEGFSPVAVLWLAGIIRRQRAQILHTHGRGAAVYGALAASLARPRKWIHTVHRADGDRISSRPAVRRFVTGRMTRIVAVSNAARREFEQQHAGASEKAQVISNGIHVERFQGNKESSFSGVTVGAVANLSPDKDHETLLRGFAEFLKRCSGARLVVVGDGPCAGDVRSMAQRLGISGAVEFTGFRTDVPALLRTFDVFAHAAHTEGLGLAILEAMAARVPVVASDVGGIPEIVRNAINGRLFPAGNAGALCQALAEAVDQPDATAAMAEQGFHDVVDRFSVESMCAAYERLYRSP